MAEALENEFCRYGHLRTDANTIRRWGHGLRCRLCEKTQRALRHGNAKETKAWKECLVREAAGGMLPERDDATTQAILNPKRGYRVKIGTRFARLPECHGRLRAAEDALAEGNKDFALLQVLETMAALKAIMEGGAS